MYKLHINAHTFDRFTCFPRCSPRDFMESHAHYLSTQSLKAESKELPKQFSVRARRICSKSSATPARTKKKRRWS